MSTPKKFYISDLHLGHKNILAFDNRPFFNLKEQFVRNGFDLFVIEKHIQE